MKYGFFICLSTFLTLTFILLPSAAPVQQAGTLLAVTPAVARYATGVVRPELDEEKADTLSSLLKVSRILIDPETGVGVNQIPPKTFMLYNALSHVKLGCFSTFGLSARQKEILTAWHSKFMTEHPSGVFFAPAAHDIVATRAAFGCSHYARAFMAVVKSLGLVQAPGDLRYVVSCKADDYNRALDAGDREMTINGHQFVMANIAKRWIAINTSKAEWVAMPEDFSPDRIGSPHNEPIRFESYPGIVFLIRKIGRDYADDCRDGSLDALMNIYRSGDAAGTGFSWPRWRP